MTMCVRIPSLVGCGRPNGPGCRLLAGAHERACRGLTQQEARRSCSGPARPPGFGPPPDPQGVALTSSGVKGPRRTWGLSWLNHLRSRGRRNV